MKKFILVILITLTYVISVFGQVRDSIPGIGLMELSQVNQGNSYVTFPTDIGNIEPLWFEVNIVPNFYLRESKNSRLMGVLTPQIILRIYQERSYPVRTPSWRTLGSLLNTIMGWIITTFISVTGWIFYGLG